MKEVCELAVRLRDRDNQAAYEAARELAEISGQSDAAYRYMDEFIDMMDSAHSYVRVRGMMLIAANAKWDGACRIDGIIGRYLSHITDPKPSTARRCISLLPEIARCKPALKEVILYSLRQAEVSQYPDTIRGLVLNDINRAIEAIGG